MKKQIYDEKNGLSYTVHGDYYLPDLEINEEEPTYGKYGIMRKQFLKEHWSARYQYLVPVSYTHLDVYKRQMLDNKR